MLILKQSDADEIKHWVENELKHKNDPQMIVDALSRTLMMLQADARAAIRVVREVTGWGRST